MIDFYGSEDYRRLLEWIKSSGGGDYGCIEANSEGLKNQIIEQLSRDAVLDIKEVNFSPRAKEQGYEDADLIVGNHDLKDYQQYQTIRRFSEKYPDLPVLIFTNLQGTALSTDKGETDALIGDINMNRENYIRYPSLVLFIFPKFLMTELYRRAHDFISMMAFHFDFTGWEDQLEDGFSKKPIMTAEQQMPFSGGTPPTLELKADYARRFQTAGLPILERFKTACKYLQICIYYMHTDSETKAEIDAIRQLIAETSVTTEKRRHWISKTQQLIDSYDRKISGQDFADSADIEQPPVIEKNAAFEPDDKSSPEDGALQEAHRFDEIGVDCYNKGRYEEAKNHFEKSLAIKEKILPSDSTDTAATYNNLAGVYRTLGDYDWALDDYHKALEIVEKVLSKDHPSTATTYNNLALVYQDLGDYDRALDDYQKALTIQEKVLGRDDPDTAATYNNLAGVYRELGDYDRALKFHHKALAIKEKVLGRDHPDTATTYNNLAVVYQKFGDYDRALDHYQKALAISEKVLGKEHPDTAQTYNNLAVVYQELGDYDRALSYYQKALAIQEKVLGKGHPDTAVTYNNIAVIYAKLGLYITAEKYMNKAYEICSKKLGINHPDTISIKNGLESIKKARAEKGSSSHSTA